MKLNRRVYWEDVATGELLTFKEMIERAENEYKFDDWTPLSELFNFFEETNITVEQ